MTSVNLAKLTFGVTILSALACGSATISHPGTGGGGGGAAGATGQGGGAGTAQAGNGGGGHGGSAGSATGVAGAGGGAGTSGVAGAAGGGGRAGAPGTGGAAGATGVAGAGGGGRGGTGGVSTGGTAGGTAGAGGGPTCSNTTSDALNCGACGHSCLGGDCASGICQPLLLGTIPSTTDYARQTTVTGGKVYVFSQVGRGSAQNAWQLDATTPSTPTEYMTGNGTVSCAMNGQIFWVDYTNSTAVTIDSCTFATCAATKTPIVNIASTDSVVIFPGCDRTSNEIIWGTQASSSSTFTIHRATTTGANARQITSFYFPSDGTNWGLMAPELALSNTDRLFYADNNSDGNGKAVLYYISTKTVNAAGVSIATVNAQVDTSGFQSLLTNGSLVIFSAFTPPSTSGSFTVPLPNGVLSGTPPAFTGASIFGGVVDSTNFYGSLSNSATVPGDAIVKCPLSNCASPAIVTRGQANANYFADDATAIYWTTSGTTSTEGFSVWKLAK